MALPYFHLEKYNKPYGYIILALLVALLFTFFQVNQYFQSTGGA
jgi:hypothetical protein